MTLGTVGVSVGSSTVGVSVGVRISTGSRVVVSSGVGVSDGTSVSVCVALCKSGVSVGRGVSDGTVVSLVTGFRLAVSLGVGVSSIWPMTWAAGAARLIGGGLVCVSAAGRTAAVRLWTSSDNMTSRWQAVCMDFPQRSIFPLARQ